MSGERTYKERLSEGFSKLSDRFKEASEGFTRLGGGDGESTDSPGGAKKAAGTSSATKKSFSEHLTTATTKMKDMFRTPTVAEKLVEDATASGLEGPDWGKSLAICDMVNGQRATGQEVTRAVKKRLADKDFRVQGLALTLLETLVKNCEGLFSDVASENVLDDVVAIGTDSSNPNSTKALILVEAWGEAKEELRYLPIFAETYNGLRERGIRFPGRDAESLAPIFTPAQSAPITTPQAAQREEAPTLSPEQLATKSKETFEVARNSIDLLNTVLTSSPKEETLKDELTQTLVAQVMRSQRDVQTLIQSAGDSEAILFEALNVNDDLQKVLSKYEELSGSGETTPLPTSSAAPERPSAASEHPKAVPPAQGSNPQAQVYADLLGEDEEDETALVRKNGHKNTQPAKTAQAGDDQALADLDEMIFGKEARSAGAAGAGTKVPGEKKDDLISF